MNIISQLRNGENLSNPFESFKIIIQKKEWRMI